MLPAWFTVFSIAIRLLGGAQYAWGVVVGKAKPNPITWFLWGLTPLIAFFAQLQYGLTPQAWVLLALAASPLFISMLAIIKYGLRGHFTPFSVTCGLLALLGIVLWQMTSVPELAVLFCIIADIFATLPTLQKAYRNPASEYAWPYMMSMVSMVIVLLTIQDWRFLIYAFPLYMLAVNMACFSFAAFPIRQWIEQRAIRYRA